MSSSCLSDYPPIKVIWVDSPSQSHKRICFTSILNINTSVHWKYEFKLEKWKHQIFPVNLYGHTGCLLSLLNSFNTLWTALIISFVTPYREINLSATKLFHFEIERIFQTKFDLALTSASPTVRCDSISTILNSTMPLRPQNNYTPGLDFLCISDFFLCLFL